MDYRDQFKQVRQKHQREFETAQSTNDSRGPARQSWLGCLIVVVILAAIALVLCR